MFAQVCRGRGEPVWPSFPPHTRLSAFHRLVFPPPSCCRGRKRAREIRARLCTQLMAQPQERLCLCTRDSHQTGAGSAGEELKRSQVETRLLDLQPAPAPGSVLERKLKLLQTAENPLNAYQSVCPPHPDSAGALVPAGWRSQIGGAAMLSDAASGVTSRSVNHGALSCAAARLCEEVYL